MAKRAHFCSHCWTDLEPQQTRCPGCHTELGGSGLFAVVDGEKPSEIFRTMIAGADSASDTDLEPLAFTA